MAFVALVKASGCHHMNMAEGLCLGHWQSIGKTELCRSTSVPLKLGLAGQVTILKGRDDVPRFLMGADLLVHPAYVENTGTVLLEAIVAGLPVIATDICGYAPYIEQADAGRLIPSPFQQETFNAMLESMMTKLEYSDWSANGIAFAAVADIYDMPKLAADYICLE